MEFNEGVLLDKFKMAAAEEQNSVVLRLRGPK